MLIEFVNCPLSWTVGLTVGLLTGNEGPESTESIRSLLESNAAFLALSNVSFEGNGGRFRVPFNWRFPLLDFREGRGGRTGCLEVLEAVVTALVGLVILDIEGVLFAGCGLSVKDFVLDLGSTLAGRGGSSTSPHAGALTLFSSDLVLVVVSLGALYPFED